MNKNVFEKFSIFSVKKRRSNKARILKKPKSRMLRIVRVKRVMTEKYGNSQSSSDGNQYKWIKLPSTGHKETDERRVSKTFY